MSITRMRRLPMDTSRRRACVCWIAFSRGASANAAPVAIKVRRFMAFEVVRSFHEKPGNVNETD
jgi:hypothetical protein